jgi:DNA-binding MarR family transcriptional regulator
MAKTEKSLFQLSMEMKDHCVVYRWRMLSRLITSTLDNALRPLGMTSSQLNILAIVAGMQGNATPKEIAYYMQMEKSTVTRALSPMERDGWLKVSSHPDDGRVSVIALSKKGEKIYRQSYKPWKEANDKICGMIGRSADEVDFFVSQALGRSDISSIGPIPEVPDEAYKAAGAQRKKKPQ